MAQPENRPGGNRPPPGSPEPNFNWRGVILFALAIVLIGGALFFRNNALTNARDMTYPEFLEKAKNDKIIKNNPDYPFELISEPGSQTDTLRGFLKADPPNQPPTPFKVQVNLLFLQDSLYKTLEQFELRPAQRSDNNFVAGVLILSPFAWVGRRLA